MFDDNSRYAKLIPYATTDRRGRRVDVVPAAEAPHQVELGAHQRKQGERLDHYAAKYLGDATAWWRIAEKNDVMLPEALTEALEISIPRKER
jgi:hypothetical protein